MRIPSYKNLRYTDYPQEAQKTIEQLSYTVNNAFEGLFGIINNNVSIRDNLFVSVNDLTVIVDAKGNPTSTLSYGISNSNTIDGTQVIRAVSNGNNNIYATSTPFITYSQNGSKITVVNIAGLPAGTPFSVRVITYLGGST